MNRHQVSKIRLSPDVIDCIVFWSKNPAPMLPRLGELADYMYYFQFTVTPYDRELETGLPQKESVIETFRRLSDRIGPKRVIWRYDPILFSQSMDVSYHLHGFEAIAKRLASCTQTCVISFVDLYQKTRRNLRETTAREPSADEITRLAAGLAAIASSYGIRIQSCAERIDLEPMGIRHGRCIDRMLIEKLLGAGWRSPRTGTNGRSVDVCRVWISGPMIHAATAVCIAMPTLIWGRCIGTGCCMIRRRRC